MKLNRTMSKWATGIVAVMVMMGASPWIASVHAEIDADKQAAILALCEQEGEDSDAIEALKAEFNGMSEAELGEALQAVIKSASADRRSIAAERYVAAAIGMAQEDDLNVLSVAQQLGSGMVRGVLALEDLNDEQLRDQLANISSACTTAGMSASVPQNRIGVAKQFAYGAIGSAGTEQQVEIVSNSVTLGALNSVGSDQANDIVFGITESGLKAAPAEFDNAVGNGVRRGANDFDPDYGQTVEDRINNIQRGSDREGAYVPRIIDDPETSPSN